MAIIRQSFKMSLQNIVNNKMRSFLTMLGIVIGVAAVIALITIVQGFSDSVVSEFSDLGAGTLTVNAYGTSMKQGLTENDLAELEKVKGVGGISPTASLTSTAVFGSEAFDKVTVDGKSDIYFIHNNIIKSGRALNASDIENQAHVCIVDQTFMKSVMKGHAVLGNTILLDGYEYTIVGIRDDDTSLMAAFSGSGDDGTVIVPYKNALRMTGNANVSSLEVYVAEGYTSSEVVDNLSLALDNVYNDADNSYSILNMETLMQSLDTILGMLSTMLAGIASIALLVGGIGIMNMMLVSVTERTKEIGLRKALGAEPSRIQMQFLLESIVLSVIGGILGVLVGLLIAYVAAAIMDTAFGISPGAILLGLTFSLVVGVIFGWAPARRASRLNPIDALRAD
ncbi:MAG: ABC transporter permease [Lachnospiraceae bacterium]|nr:ABC transporter permease [Lachnospiraceae bacterium]